MNGAAGAGADLLYSEVEEDLRAGVRAVLTDRCPPASVIDRLDGAHPHDLDLWRVLAQDLGLAGLLVPENLGGAGASPREAGVVLEELGRAVAPVPYLTSAVLAASVLRLCGAGDGDAAALGPLAAGTAAHVVAVPLPSPPGEAAPPTVVAEGASLTGRVTAVADAEIADALVVPAVVAGEPGLFVVLTGGPGVSVEPRTSLDNTRRLADVRLVQAPGRLVSTGSQAAHALSSGLEVAAGLLASEQVGIAQWCLDTTVAYVKERRQFARPVGSFQALKHRLADLWAQVGSARAVARYAADALASASPDTAVAVSVAQAYCSEVAVLAAEECVQMHGGIGMTWEHPAHLYLKRAKADQIAFGTPGMHRARLAALVDLLPPPSGPPR